MSKCSVVWCPQPGLEDGLLPGLCVEHRDEVLDKQKVAKRVVEHAELPAATTVCTWCGATPSTRSLTRVDDGRWYCHYCYVNRHRPASPSSPDVFSANDVASGALSVSAQCRACGYSGHASTVHPRVPVHRAYSYFQLAPGQPICDSCCVRVARTPVS